MPPPFPNVGYMMDHEQVDITSPLVDFDNSGIHTRGNSGILGGSRISEGVLSYTSWGKTYVLLGETERNEPSPAAHVSVLSAAPAAFSSASTFWVSRLLTTPLSLASSVSHLRYSSLGLKLKLKRKGGGGSRGKDAEEGKPAEQHQAVVPPPNDRGIHR